MFKRYLKKFNVVFVFMWISCISIPEKPYQYSNECVAQFFQFKKRMNEIKSENRIFSIGIIASTLGVGFWMGSIALTPMMILPFTQFRNYSKVKELNNEYRVNHFKEEFS